MGGADFIFEGLTAILFYVKLYKTACHKRISHGKGKDYMAENKDLYVEYDKNMVVSASIGDVDVEMYDIRKEPFEVYGFYDYKNQPWFIRMPDDAASEISDGVRYACRETSGGRVRFSTDSDYIAIRAEMASVGGYGSYVTLLRTGGFDLYVDEERESRFQAAFVPPYGMEDGYEQLMRFETSKMRNITINFPTHSRVKNLYIGLKPGSKLSKGKSYRNEKPVLCYGSSITHGTDATRPGLTYPHMLSRALNINIYNLGFSGQCKGERRMAEYIADMDIAAFVMDYDHNAPTYEHLERTHKPFFEIIRERHPTLPIIMLTRPSIYPDSAGDQRNREIIRRTYDEARERGDENVYFIDGGEYMKNYGYDDCIVDGVHPNDMGFRAMADAILVYLREIVAKSEDFN